MKQFTDAKGNAWSLTINISTVKRCLDLLGINLLEPEKGDPPLLVRFTDEILLCDIIYCLCKDQADQKGITDEDFGKSLDGESILRASNAFYEELIHFFQSRGQNHRAISIQKQMETILASMKRVEEEIQKIDIEKQINTAFGSGSGELQGS